MRTQKTTAATTTTPKSTDFGNSKPKNTPLIPACIYTKSTPFANT